MIGFEPSGALAPDASPVVALENLEPRPLPATAIERRVVATSGPAPAHPTNAERSARRGFGARESAPHASISAAATSSRA